MKKLPNLNIKGKLLTGLTLCLVLSVVGAAAAQELVRSITITPPTASFKIDPGARTEGQMKIINDSTNPITFSVSVQDYIVVDTVGTPNLLPPNTLNNKYSAANWLGVSPETFTVLPGQKQTVNYYIQVPAGARPGGHYAAAVFTPQAKAGAGSGAVVTGEVGTLFYITVNGPVTESSIVSRFFANPFQEYGPVKVLTQIKNLGDLHTAPQGSVTVSGLFYNKTQQLPTHNIFPGVARDFENTLGRTFMLGRYKAVLLASYGVNKNLPLTATLYFWVFPWRLALVIVLVIVAVILGYMYFKKRKKEGSSGTEELRKEEVKEEPKTKEKTS